MDAAGLDTFPVLGISQGAAVAVAYAARYPERVSSLVLFGGLLVWALAEMQAINSAEPGWTPPPKAPAKKKITLTIITLAVFAVITAIHAALGVWPFPR